MYACPRRVDLTFYGVEPWRGRNLIYDESRAAVPIGYLLPVHPGFAFFPRKRLSGSKDVNQRVTYLRVSQVGQLGPVVGYVSRISRLTRRRCCGLSSRK